MSMRTLKLSEKCAADWLTTNRAQVKDVRMRRLLAIILASSIIFLGVSVPPTGAAISGGTWTLTTESVNLGLSGVSPYVERTSAGLDRLYFASEAALPDPIMITDCTDAGVCTRQTLASRFNSDATIVTLKDGTRKVFFVEMSQSAKKIRYATLGSTGLSHGTLSDLDVAGASVSGAEMAWGVPDAVVLPDGRVRVYWVLSDQATGKPGLPEAIASATSTDANATAFVRDAGFRLTGGYVDTKILRAKDGDWVMITSTGPGVGTQFLYIATSADGLTWSVNSQPISSSAESALDPTGYETSDKTWRIYYASAQPGMIVNRTYTLKRAILTWKEAVATPTPTPTPTVSATPTPTPTVVSTPTPIPSTKVVKATTITCIKGKLTKKVTAVNPKCPTGYKKK